MRILLLASALLLSPLSVSAADWTIGAAAGPFFFGQFAESHFTIVNGESTVRITTSLTAKTRAGLLLDLERKFNDRVSIRFEAAANQAPISTTTDDDDSRDDGVSLDVGEISVVTLAIPLVFRFNRGGSLRPYVLAGLSWALYDFHPDVSARSVPLFEGTRSRLGATAGLGLDWWLSDQWAIFGQTSDIYTRSPLSPDDFSGPRPRRFSIENPHNIHTTLGLRYAF